MSINAIQTEPKSHIDELKEFKYKAKRDLVLKTLLTAAVIIAAIALTILFHGSFLATGIGVILISCFAIFQYYNCYRDSKNVFLLAANAITDKLPDNWDELKTPPFSQKCQNWLKNLFKI